MSQSKTPRPPKPRNVNAQDAFITEYFANGGRKQAAAKVVGVDYSTVKRWFQHDAAFRERVEDFRDMWRDQLRAVAFKRASEKSDTLLIFLLKSLEPETYDDQVRNAKYLAAHNIQTEQFIPVRAVLVADAPPPGVEPERVEEKVEH